MFCAALLGRGVDNVSVFGAAAGFLAADFAAGFFAAVFFVPAAVFFAGAFFAAGFFAVFAADLDSASGAVSVTFTGTVYETGYFTTKPLPLGAGGAFELWVYHTGPAPAAAYCFDGGDYQALTPAETGSGVNSDGEACSLLRFLIPDAAEKTLSLRFTLSSSATLVRECCGILL